MAEVSTVLHLFRSTRFMEVRILGFIWDPRKYSAIHYFSTCIIIEGYLEEKCITVFASHSYKSNAASYSFRLQSFSYFDKSCSDLFVDHCRRPSWTFEMHWTPMCVCVCVMGGGCLDCQIQCYMPAMFTSSCQLATTSAQALQQVSSSFVIFVSLYDVKWIKKLIIMVVFISFWQSQVVSTSSQQLVCVYSLKDRVCLCCERFHGGNCSGK